MKKRAGLALKIASAPRALHRQLFANGGGRIAYFVDGLLQLVLRTTKRLGPILDLEVFMHVDLATVALVPFGETVAHRPPPSPVRAARHRERPSAHARHSEPGWPGLLLPLGLRDPACRYSTSLVEKTPSGTPRSLV